jgi:hypothetical protein
MINIAHKDDLITVDLRCKQIRFVPNGLVTGSQEQITFHNLSNGDVEGYEYLFKEDLHLFLKCIREDFLEFDNIKLSKDMKLINLEEI